MSGYDDANEVRRDYRAPYTSHHPIPTIQKYRREKEARKAEATGGGGDTNEDFLTLSKSNRARESSTISPNRADDAAGGRSDSAAAQEHGTDEGGYDDDEDSDEAEEDETPVDTSEANPVARNAKKRRKGLMKKSRDERAEREVTDPVTHLPVRISDFTADTLEEVEENPPPFGTTPRTATGLSNKTKTDDDLTSESEEMHKGHQSINALFPPPGFDTMRKELTHVLQLAITVGCIGLLSIGLIAFGLQRLVRWVDLPVRITDYSIERTVANFAPLLAVAVLGAGGIWMLVRGVRGWLANRIGDIWDDHVWRASRQSNRREAKAHETETVTWLNMLVGSVWPLINPDLFISLADTLEDVMQASLPSLVQMVSVEDIGQGRENLRILGIRWLPTGAASRAVGTDGKLESAEASKKHNDREVQGEGELDESAESTDETSNGKKSQSNSQDGTDKQISEGMEAEEGDFVNLEVAFAYRARASKSFDDRTKDMHLYLAFYLPGNIKIPVWVDVRGIIGTVRLRLQLAPDPPFFALCTLTFLGQPKVDIGCVPLVKRGLNIMDLPLISDFVQSSVDAAMAQYVAPKSLTLDLKDMLAGDDFKKDTNARGVIVVDIKRGYDFKMGDVSVPMISDGKSDPYVSVGWAKFGKPMWSTRVLISEMEPVWQETAYILVTQEELNVHERLRVQLWDSDRFTADDDLGRIELDLKKIMRDDASNGKMCDRTDGFRALKVGENMPGKLEWSVGYFSKCRIQKCQLEKQTFDPEVRSMEQLEEKVDEACRRKLREASVKEGKHPHEADELEQQKAQEKKMRQDAMIISAPPPDKFPSGIFSIQIHQITGLEFQKASKSDVDKAAGESDESETGDGLPSAYCEVILNHSKVFKTRTKPKNARPFYNAGTERFISDWRSAEVFISVRDARVSEDDPLIGIVHLQLGDIFKERSQINGFYPLTGGVGYGRVRVSMVWRSVQLQAPQEALGWNVGTLDIQPSVSMSDVPDKVKDLRLQFHSDIGRRKLHANQGEQEWSSRRRRNLRLPVHKRYSSCLAVQFRSHGILREKTVAFSILWLQDIPDDEERTVTVPVWQGNFNRAKSCYLDEYGEKIGSIRLTLTFRSGLGSAHKKWAKNDPNICHVLEVLDVARDHFEIRKTEQAAGIVELSSEDTSDDSSDDDGEEARDDKGDDVGVNEGKADTITNDEESQDDGSKDEGSKDEGSSEHGKANNLIEQAKEHMTNAKRDNRKQRGIMQYKAPRTAMWAYGKAGRAESKIKSIFSRHTREPGIETEV